ncbi:Uncharacterised protein [Mycobacteroides abscessus subsp. abscessus]|nr:Uncharacterised protein [Mycobacteroides abscessus subsp. abscessus]
MFDMLNHVNDHLSITVRNINGDIVRSQLISSQCFDKIELVILDADTD